MNHGRAQKSRKKYDFAFDRRAQATVCDRAVAGSPGNRYDMDEGQILARLNLLRIEHRDLDAAVAALGEAAVGGTPDQLQMMRLKKRKLSLRDEIARLEDMLIPDIIA